MKSMKIGIFKSFALLLVTYYPTSVHGQIIDTERYHRASLISMLIERPMYPFNDEISDAFKNVPMPNRFNNHNLGVRIVRFATQEYTSQEEYIEQFIEKSFLSNRAIAKWFDWNKEDGSFSMDIIKERGFYDATALEHEIANNTIRGSAILEDAGENLISQTYLVMNDICYKGEYGIHKSDNEVGNKNKFDINIVSYLFQLSWTAQNTNVFWSQFWPSTKNFTSVAIPFNFEFKAKVSSDYSDSSKDISQNDLIKRAVARSIDLNIAKLQRIYPDFRIKARLLSTNPLYAEIGLKENINEDSKFEVLECLVDSKGIEKYRRIGVVKPMKGKIGDNRFMSESSNIGTYFEIVKGHGFFPGMLLREI